MTRFQTSLAVVAFICVAAVLGSLTKTPVIESASQHGPSPTSPVPSATEAAPDHLRITMGIFESIGPPLRYDQLKTLIGPGELISQTYAGGFVTEGYRWKNDDGSFMHLVIQNGQVVSKQQVGLH